MIRIANQRDVEQEEANRGKEKEAFRICLEKIRDHGLRSTLTLCTVPFWPSSVVTESPMPGSRLFSSS